MAILTSRFAWCCWGITSVRESFARKLLSRCSSYAEDFLLRCLIYDMAMARELTSIVNMSNADKASPDDYVSEFWETEQHKLEDLCRQQERMPNLSSQCGAISSARRGLGGVRPLPTHLLVREAATHIHPDAPHSHATP